MLIFKYILNLKKKKKKKNFSEKHIFMTVKSITSKVI
jgi:hypothetical protein